MRVAIALLALSIALPATAADNGATPARPASGPNCPHTSSYVANGSGAYRNEPLRPRKLTELPPGTAYMAVYRHIGGCEAPLTMSDYRSPRRR